MAPAEDGPQEWEAAIQRAFDRGADFLRVDGHSLRSKFLRDTLEHGMKKGWLVRGELVDLREQQDSYVPYRLTESGKSRFIRKVTS